MAKKSMRSPDGTSALPVLHDDEGSESRATETEFAASLPSLMPESGETLTVLVGNEIGREFPLFEEVTTLGRGKDCTIPVAEHGVSRHHASITRDGEHRILKDHNSKNGTFVNGRRIMEHRLRPGDEIQLGVGLSLAFTHGKDARARREQHQAARVRRLHEQMTVGRVEGGLSDAVTGIAHEINTPLGVANTANAMIASLVDEIAAAPDAPTVQELLGDLKQATVLLGKNLEKASNLVRTFKQLSASQLSDEYTTCDLAELIEDFVETSKTETTGLIFRVSWTEGAKFPWSGYPGHLTKALSILLRNAVRYAYEGKSGGEIDVRLRTRQQHYVIDLEDYGKGITPDMLPRIFEPFVTSGRELGGVGLGLTIVRNIVTTLLHGEIECVSEEGKGTRFVVRVPHVVPREP